METATFDDRRNVRRFDALLVLEFRSLKYNEGPFFGISRNFSADGLSFESREFKAMAGDPFEFKLNNPGDGASVSFMGEIAWKKMHDKFDCLTGIKLTDPDTLTLNQIFSIVSSSEKIHEDAVLSQMNSDETAGIDQPLDNMTESLERAYSLPREMPGNTKRKYIFLNTAIIIILLSSLYLLYMAFSLSPDKRDMQALPVDGFYQDEEILVIRPERADLLSIMSPEKFRTLTEPPAASRFEIAEVRPPAAKVAADRPEVTALNKQLSTKRRPPAKNTYSENVIAKTERPFVLTKSSFTKEVTNEPLNAGVIVTPSVPGTDIKTSRALNDGVKTREDGPEEIQPEALNSNRIVEAALIIGANRESGKKTDKKGSVLMPYLMIAAAPRVLFEDSFENSNDWPVINTATNMAYIKNGKYFIESRAGASVFPVIGPDIKDADDHRIDVRLSKKNATGDYSYGIIWGALNQTNYYSFTVEDNGGYTISRISNGAPSLLSFGSRSRPFLDRNGNNIFSVLRRGNITSFYINNNIIYKISGLPLYGRRSGFIVDGMCRIEVENIRITSAG